MLLYNKYRPRTLNDIVGQSINVKILKNLVDSGNIRPCYIFSGYKGTGKTSVSRIMAKMVNCEKGITSTPCLECENCKSIENGSAIEVNEIDAASHNGVDDIRKINEEVNFASLGMRYKIYILDEAHMLTKQAWNAFLKNLEEPPEKVIFIICTTEVNQIPETVRCRCLRFNFKKLTSEEIYSFLKYVCDKEDVKYEDNALKIISKNSKGGMRDALTELERVIIAADNGIITENVASQATMSFNYKVVFYLAKAILQGTMSNTLLITQGLDKSGVAPPAILDELIEFLHSVYSYQIMKNESALLFASTEQKNDIMSLANEFDNDRLAKVISELSEGYKTLPYNPNPRYFLDVLIHQASKTYNGSPPF